MRYLPLWGCLGEHIPNLKPAPAQRPNPTLGTQWPEATGGTVERKQAPQNTTRPPPNSPAQSLGTQRPEATGGAVERKRA